MAATLNPIVPFVSDAGRKTVSRAALMSRIEQYLSEIVAQCDLASRAVGNTTATVPNYIVKDINESLDRLGLVDFNAPHSASDLVSFRRQFKLLRTKFLSALKEMVQYLAVDDPASSVAAATKIAALQALDGGEALWSIMDVYWSEGDVPISDKDKIGATPKAMNGFTGVAGTWRRPHAVAGYQPAFGNIPDFAEEVVLGLLPYEEELIVPVGGQSPFGAPALDAAYSRDAYMVAKVAEMLADTTIADGLANLNPLTLAAANVRGIFTVGARVVPAGLHSAEWYLTVLYLTATFTDVDTSSFTRGIGI